MQGERKNYWRFKNRVFPLSYDEREKQEFRDKEEENKIRNENGFMDYKKLERLINLKNRDINDDLVRKHFLVQDLGGLLEKFKKLKNNAEKNKIQANLMNSGLRDLKKRNWRYEWTRKGNRKPKWNSKYCWKDSWI